MDVEKNRFDQNKGKGRKWAGLILLVIGLIFLFRSVGIYLPDWILGWPIIFIFGGLYISANSNFKSPWGLLFIFIGLLMVAGNIFDGFHAHDFIAPLCFFGAGLYLILGRRKRNARYREQQFTWDKRVPEQKDEVISEAEVIDETKASQEPNNNFYSGQYSTPYDSVEDFIDAVSIFGSVKKNLFSKNFKGGEIVTIMGGAEINLSQAELKGPVVIEITQIFGGTKLIVPPQWKISSDLAALFGGIEDKRPLVPAGSIDDSKVLIIKGTSIFGGIDIRSF